MPEITFEGVKSPPSSDFVKFTAKVWNDSDPPIEVATGTSIQYQGDEETQERTLSVSWSDPGTDIFHVGILYEGTDSGAFIRLNTDQTGMLSYQGPSFRWNNISSKNIWAILNNPPHNPIKSGTVAGLIAGFRLAYTVAAPFSESEPPEADFSATFREGGSPICAQFTDESTDTKTGGPKAPTSWLYEIKPSGMNLPFEAFSTEKNPTKLIDLILRKS